MPYYKFEENDVFHNRIKAYPSCEFIIHSGSTYYNNKHAVAGEYNDPVKHVPAGHISLYEMNIDRFAAGHNYSAPVPKYTEVTFASDSKNDYGGNYVAFYPAGKMGIHQRIVFWFNDGDDSAPDVVAAKFVEVDLSAAGDDTAEEFSVKFQAAIAAQSEFDATLQAGAVVRVLLLGVVGESNADPETNISSGVLTIETVIGKETLIYQFITKNGSFSSFKTIDTNKFNQDFVYGDIITSSYPLSATILREYFTEGLPGNIKVDPKELNHPQVDALTKEIVIEEDPDTGMPKIEEKEDVPELEKKHLWALKNTFDYYIPVSYHYAFSSQSLEHGRSDGQISDAHAPWNKLEQESTLIDIPSIFYGTAIKKGTADLRFYFTGALIGQLRDEKQNGELIQVGPPGSVGSGSVAGVVLYSEGLFFLTGSWDLGDEVTDPRGSGKYKPTATEQSSVYSSKWIYFGAGMSSSVDLWTDVHYTSLNSLNSSSYSLAFSGTNYIPTVTMMAHAKKGYLNHSNNPTFIEYNQSTGALTGTFKYEEPDSLIIKNTISSSYCTDYTASFKKQTFISKIGIYDKDKNLIGVAKLANPVRKLETDEYTFKLKLDI